MWMDFIKPAIKRNKDVFSEIKSHQLPVVVYGAKPYAEWVTNCLHEHGIEVYGYTVDKKHFTKDALLGKPVFVFEEIKKEAGRYVFVLGTISRKKLIQRFLEDSSITKYYLDTDAQEPITYEYVREHYAAFDETYHWLEDDLSRKTFCAFLNLKISGDIFYNLEVVQANQYQYFDKIMAPFKSGVFVDCGAYDGDTLDNFIAWSGGKYEKIYAFEPEEDNRKRMEVMLREKKYDNIEVLPYGVWDKTEVLRFSADNATGSAVDTTGNVEIHAEAIDNVITRKSSNTPFYIKMDIEGSELKALHGAAETISVCPPPMAICVYHRADDLITIPQYIKSFETSKVRYKFYLRKYMPTRAIELVLYAVPYEV